MSMILVVEPDPAFAERITTALEPHGLSISVVGDRGAALEGAAARPPRLVLVDSGLPEAEELLAAFAARGGGPGAIALVPAWAGSRAAADYQADAIVTKPFSDDDLRATVTRLLEQGPATGGTASPPAWM
ncbi:MAG: response regulator, partial [Acidobacteria bacterium]